MSSFRHELFDGTESFNALKSRSLVAEDAGVTETLRAMAERVGMSAFIEIQKSTSPPSFLSMLTSEEDRGKDIKRDTSSLDDLGVHKKLILLDKFQDDLPRVPRTLGI